MVKAFEKLIMTCITFAMYKDKFTSTVQLAIDELESSQGDASAVSMDKRWEFYRKFSQNWEHWCVPVIALFLSAILSFFTVSGSMWVMNSCDIYGT